MMKEMIKGGKEKILERNLYIHNIYQQTTPLLEELLTKLEISKE